MAPQGPKKAAASPWTASKERAASEREEKREAVLNAAAKAFSERSFHKTSLDDIAERLGVSKPTLYYYTKSKDDLLEAVIARALEGVLSVSAANPHASGLEQLKAFLRHYAEVITNDYCRCLLQISQADLSEEATVRVREILRVVDDRIRSLLEKGINDGSIAPCDIRLTTFTMAGALNWIPRWYSPGGELGLREVGEIVVNQLVSGILPKR